jgi:hypothetical protein
MLAGEVYTPGELASRVNLTVPAVAVILDFLMRYGFVIRVSRREQLFVKEAHAPSPRNVVKIFQTMTQLTLGDDNPRAPGRPEMRD